jgi:PAS domain S-box-containing protein
MVNQWFLSTGDVSVDAIPYSYDPVIVAASIVVAIFASFAAFQFSRHIGAATGRATSALSLAGGALSMGSGIWSMHFIAMQAVNMGHETRYDVGLTVLSAVFAIAASGGAFWILARPCSRAVRLAAGGTLMGAGIGAMHYTGMAAMQMHGVIRYDPLLFAASVIVAVTLSAFALSLIMRESEMANRRGRLLSRLVGATLMGLSVSAMHYTGMAAAFFLPARGGALTGIEIDQEITAATVGLLAVILVSLSMAALAIDRRLQLSRHALSRSENELDAAIEAISEGFAQFDANDRLVRCNSRFRSFFGENAYRIVPGIDYRSVVLAGAGRRDKMNEIEDFDAYMAERMAQHEQQHLRFEIKLADGVWVQASERRTDDGGTVAVRTDITALKQREAALQESEARHRQLIDYLPDGVLIRCDGEIIYANAAALAMYGAKSSDALVGTPMLDRVAVEERGEVADRMRQLAAGETITVQRQRTHLRLDGTAMPVEVSGLGFEWDGREAVLTLIRDVTRRRQREEALRESEERYRGLIEHSPDSVLIHHHGTITVANRAAAKMYGAESPDALIGTDLLERIPVALRDAVRVLIGEDTRNGFPDAPRESEHLRMDGTAFPIEITGLALDWHGKPSHMLIVRDITIRRQQEAARLALEDRLRRSERMEALGTLAGGTAHEFNNLLMPIIGLTEIVLEDMGEDDPAAPNLNMVLKNANHAAALVKKILAFSRSDDRQAAAAELPEMVDEAVDLLRPGLPSSIALEVTVEGAVGKVMANRTQIHQILMNIGTNAAHAMEGRVGRIDIRLSAGRYPDGVQGRVVNLPPGRYARLSIADNGKGIDDETLQRIFEPFFTTKEVGVGTGLGLSIIHSIVTGLGGGIDAESEPGAGTRFDIYLPSVAEPAVASAAE